MTRISLELEGMLDIAGLQRKPMYTVQEAARLFAANDATIYRWIKEESLTAIKPSRLAPLRISIIAIDWFLRDRSYKNLQGEWDAA